MSDPKPMPLSDFDIASIYAKWDENDSFAGSYADLMRLVEDEVNRRWESTLKDAIAESWLCESKSLVLRIGRLYRFRPDAECKSCQALKAEHDTAYRLEE